MQTNLRWVVMIKKHKFDTQNGTLVNIPNLDSYDHIKIPENVTDISDDVLKKFYSCTVEIPPSVKSLDISLSNSTHFIVPETTKLKKTKRIFLLQLSVYDVVTNSIKYKICIPDTKDSRKFNDIVDAFLKKPNDGWFEEYDNYAQKFMLDSVKRDVAVGRLSHPYCLSDNKRKWYEAFIERSLFFEEESEWPLRRTLSDDDVDRFELYTRYRAVNKGNIKWILELAETFPKSEKCLAYLKNLFESENLK